MGSKPLDIRRIAKIFNIYFLICNRPRILYKPYIILTMNYDNGPELMNIIIVTMLCSPHKLYILVIKFCKEL
jgi:hypothetical protein